MAPRVLGIDPGLQITGYGCIGVDGTAMSLVDAGIFRFKPSTSVASRLVELERDLRDTIEAVEPDLVAVEALFSHYAHPRTAVTMGHARGVILLVIARAGLPIVEIPATHAKKTITGNGHAGKEQVQRAVQWQLGLSSVPEPADVADAIAIAMTGSKHLREAKATR